MFFDIWKGWSIAVSCIFVPVAIIFAVFCPESAGGAALYFFPVMVPLMAALQGVLVATIVCLGLKIQTALKNIKKS